MAWGQRGGSVKAEYSGVTATWGRRQGCVEAECSCVVAVWGMHLNGRSMYLSYFGFSMCLFSYLSTSA